MKILTVRLLQPLIDVLKSRGWLLAGTTRWPWISCCRISRQWIAAGNSSSILNYPLALWLRACSNSLAIVVFNLVEGYKVWVRLLHMAWLVCLVRVCPCLVWWEILRATQICCSRRSNDASWLGVLKAQLAHLLHLWLHRKSNACLWCNNAWWIGHAHAAVIAWTHEVVAGHSEIDETLLVFLLFLLCRHLLKSYKLILDLFGRLLSKNYFVIGRMFL
jgi:hypothetical protein